MNLDQGVRMKVRITKVPDGPAPEWVRKAWVGMILVGEATSPDSVEADFATGVPIENRGAGFAVCTDVAIELLSEKSPDAADWFRKNVPEGMPFLSFGSNEYEVMEKGEFRHPLLSD